MSIRLHYSLSLHQQLLKSLQKHHQILSFGHHVIRKPFKQTSSSTTKRNLETQTQLTSEPLTSSSSSNINNSTNNLTDNFLDTNPSPQLMSLDQIVLIKSEKRLIYAMRDLYKYKVIGFDTEWSHTSPHNPPHLLQFSTPKRAYLLPLYLPNLHETFLKATKDILTNKNIIKVGYDLRQDISNLSMLSISINNTIDLRFDLNYHQGLSKASIDYLRLEFMKDRRISTSDWSNYDEYTSEQLIYAGNDAYVSWLLYEKCFCFGTNRIKPEYSSSVTNLTVNTSLNTINPEANPSTNNESPLFDDKDWIYKKIQSNIQHNQVVIPSTKNNDWSETFLNNINQFKTKSTNLQSYQSNQNNANSELFMINLRPKGTHSINDPLSITSNQPNLIDNNNNNSSEDDQINPKSAKTMQSLYNKGPIIWYYDLFWV